MSRPWPARVGILGAGALGSLFAYQLTSHTSAEVWLLARSPVPGDVEVEAERRVAVRVTDRPQAPVDLLIVLVKSYATADAVRWAGPAVGPATVALTLQNGLGNAEALAAALGPDRVLAGTTAMGATLLGPGRVRRGGAGATRLAPWSPAPGGAAHVPPVATAAAQRAAAVAGLLTQARIPTEVTNDPLPLLWAKVAVNCAINPLTALLRVPNGELLARPDARALATAAAREAAAVAAAAGVTLENDPAERALEVARATAANRSSMLQDIERGRRTEIDAINGAVAQKAQELGVPAPVNETLTALVRALTP